MVSVFLAVSEAGGGCVGKKIGRGEGS